VSGRRIRPAPRSGVDTFLCGAPEFGATDVPGGDYAYVLAMYLGDGSIARHARGVYRLRVTLDSRYALIVDECRQRIASVMRGRRVSVFPRRGENACDVSCYSKHWPCLLPQHSSGPKHSRPIRLEAWQDRIVAAHADQLVRGFIHSDGTRHLNRVNGRQYPRYMFTNQSADIREIFSRACDRLGVRWTQSYWKTISIARAQSVELLDSFVGPKA
jgi:hypothetical protein